MHRSLTQNHLVTLLFDDIRPDLRSAMLEEVSANWMLKESYRDLKLAKLSLPKIVRRPSQKSVDAILSYSKRSLVEA